MPFFKNLKNKTVKTGKRLLGYEQLQTGTIQQTQALKDIIRYNTTKVEPKDDVYLPKQQVTEAQHGFKRLVVIFMIMFVLALIYALANLLKQNWIIALLALSFAVLTLSLAFRYHFWLYQIKKKTLGMEFNDYYQDEIKSHFHSIKKPQGRNKDQA